MRCWPPEITDLGSPALADEPDVPGCTCKHSQAPRDGPSFSPGSFHLSSCSSLLTSLLIFSGPCLSPPLHPHLLFQLGDLKLVGLYHFQGLITALPCCLQSRIQSRAGIASVFYLALPYAFTLSAQAKSSRFTLPIHV